MGILRKRVSVGGVVQGVGFRPFIWRLAHRHGLDGWVENHARGVVMEVQGESMAVNAFLGDLRDGPPLAVVAELACEDFPVDPEAPRGFVIHETGASGSGPAGVRVPPDIAPCAACLDEIRDPSNRRHGYPFTTCADCGPRFTIIGAIPYDRPRTTMRSFPMCPACMAEYADPASRRFHAQPIACPDCGPMPWFTTAAAAGGVAVDRPACGILGSEAIEKARHRLLAGDILAIKGIGGFHLACDASNAGAVGRLRDRKHRVGKPFAVMVADLGQARACAVIEPQEERLLAGWDRPIVLLRKRVASGSLTDAVAPGNDFIGLMLPSSPLHHLMVEGMPPLVMTSGNLSEEPITRTNADAAARLTRLADGFLMHDREIHVPCDDSVARCVEGAVLPIRRSRGHAPLPIRLATDGPRVLAVGGELKAAACLVGGRDAFLGPHIGDMENLETLDALDRSARHLIALFGVEPEVIACDMHPGYLSSAWARRFAADRGIPVVSVQHHEAHVASLMAEHGSEDAPLIGICFDGTGFGRDGVIQGGEVLVVRDGVVVRAAHLVPFPLPGGDASIRHPWRVAVSLLEAAGIGWRDQLPPCREVTDGERRILWRQLHANLNCPATTSMGRLFDAVAALAGVRQSITYEAEAAINLETLAARSGPADGPYPLPLAGGEPMRIDWRPLVGAVVRDLEAGVAAGVIAARFHESVAVMIAEACRRLREATGIGRVGLTGGVFQNPLLVRRTVTGLRAEGFDVLLHHRVPCNDGGLALGQAVIARRSS